MEVDDTHPRATPAEEPMDATVKREPSAVGTVISGRYRLEARLASGGMGEVYRAVHTELGRPFALKLMRPELSADPGFVERFRREAMTASRLGHPNIVDIVDSGQSESGLFYFVMELLDGRPLTALIDDGPLRLPLALLLTSQIAGALEVAHQAGVVHRDLKPDNVIVVQRPGGPVAKVVDFGIAKVVAPSPDIKQTTHGVIMGTPQYMAPEQAAGVALDLRADIYALGLILYELLTGKPPLTGATAALVMSAHIAQVAPPLPAPFPALLRELVARMLAKRPGDRPASMTEVLAVLSRVPTTPARSWGKVAAVSLAAIAAAGLTVWARQRTPLAPALTRTEVVVDAGREAEPADAGALAVAGEPVRMAVPLNVAAFMDAGIKTIPTRKVPSKNPPPQLKSFPDSP